MKYSSWWGNNSNYHNYGIENKLFASKNIFKVLNSGSAKSKKKILAYVLY